MPAERGEHVPAYDNVKVWTVDPTPKVRSHSPRPRGSEDGEDRVRRIEDTWEKADRAERNAKLGVWARLIGVGILGGAILWWPYARTCGIGLATYLAATTMIIVGGLWVVACTWTCRMARTHAVGMLVGLWGVGLIAVEVLPRIGYARTDPAHPATWMCGARTIR